MPTYLVCCLVHGVSMEAEVEVVADDETAARAKVAADPPGPEHFRFSDITEWDPKAVHIVYANDRDEVG